MPFAQKRAAWLAEAHAKAIAGVLLKPRPVPRGPELPEGWRVVHVAGDVRPWRVFDSNAAFWGAYATRESAIERAALWASRRNR